MSLPSPIDVLRELKRFVTEVFFAVVVLLLVWRGLQLTLVIGGIVLVVLGHWVIGGLLFALGFLGSTIGARIRI
jgi:hypothetical protein